MGNNRRYLGTASVCIYMLMELQIQINAIADKGIQIPDSISQMSIPKTLNYGEHQKSMVQNHSVPVRSLEMSNLLRIV